MIELESIDSQTLRMSLADGATVVDVLHRLRDDAAFREHWTATLAGVSFRAFRWEMPQMSRSSLHDPYEAVVVDAPSLRRGQDPTAFASLFETETDPDVVTAPNLGGDAVLVIPRPQPGVDCYGHLAAFVRGALASQRHALWEAVARASLGRVGERPLWLSTAGGGVPWLHVRLDDRPKYYAYGPYR